MNAAIGPKQPGWRAAASRLMPTSRSLLLARSLRRLSLRDKSVLVVGAGDDPYRSLFHDVRRYVTVDIALTREVEVVADAHRLPFGNGFFDCVFAVEVLEHLADPFAFVDEAHRLLSKRGMLILTAPFMFHTHGDPSDFRRYTRQGLTKLLERFDDVTVLGQGTRAHAISDLVTTAWFPLLVPLRVFNHLLVLFQGFDSQSSAVSGFVAVATK